MVAHVCSPSYSGSGNQEIAAGDQSGQEISKTPISTNKLGVVVCVYDPSCARDKGRWIMVTVQVCPQVKR
jgi:hypothetical protein